MALTTGSPPRMRGTQIDIADVHGNNRITPAHAGNTIETKGGPVVAEDHPRACGEHWSAIQLLYLIEGSPPRMRGTL